MRYAETNVLIPVAATFAAAMLAVTVPWAAAPAVLATNAIRTLTAVQRAA